MPIEIEIVRQNVGEVFAKEKLPVSNGWPEIRDEHITKALEKLSSGRSVDGKPVYIAGGKSYYLDDTGKLCRQENHPAAQPCLWAIAHDVRPAAQSLGVRSCTDCHAIDAPLLFGAVAIDSPVVTERETTTEMSEYLLINRKYAGWFAFTFVFRPWLKVIALGCAAIIAAVLILYVFQGLARILNLLSGKKQ